LLSFFELLDGFEGEARDSVKENFFICAKVKKNEIFHNVISFVFRFAAFDFGHNSCVGNFCAGFGVFAHECLYDI